MFDFYVQNEYWFAAIQLSLAMLGMGATLALSDFNEVVRRPKGFSIGIGLQLILVPCIAYVFINSLDMHPGVAAGIAICAAVPGGAVSNIFTHIARGHTALSIALTSATAIACLVTTPLILDVLVSEFLPAGFEMPAGRIATDIAFCLLLPLMCGMLFLKYLPDSAATFSKWCIRASLFTIVLIVVGALGAGRIDLPTLGINNFLLIAAFLALLTLIAGLIPRLFKLSSDQCSAINIEVSVRNINLGVLIKASLFPAVVGIDDPIGDMALFTLLLFGGLELLAGLAIVLWSKRELSNSASLSKA